MQKISLLNNLSLDSDGYLIEINKERVFLRQGDMDGACGPYCLAMAFIINGQLDYAAVTNCEKLDRRKRVGKLFQSLSKHGAFVKEGTSVDDLTELAGVMKVKVESTIEAGQKVVTFALEQLEKGRPVIFGINGRANDNFSHWILLIGFSDDSFFALDPGYDLQTSCLWNSVITRMPLSTRFGYRYHKVQGESRNVEFCRAVAVL